MDYEQAAFEQRLAELSDDEFTELVTRTRAPAVPAKGTVVPGVGQQPQRPPNSGAAAVRIAEEAGDWKTAARLKAHQLTELSRQQQRPTWT